MQRPSLTITHDHFLAVFVNSDGEQLIFIQDRDLPPVLFDGKQGPILVGSVTRVPWTESWTAGGLLLAKDEATWLTTSILAATRWFQFRHAA